MTRNVASDGLSRMPRQLTLSRQEPLVEAAITVEPAAERVVCLELHGGRRRRAKRVGEERETTASRGGSPSFAGSRRRRVASSAKPSARGTRRLRVVRGVDVDLHPVDAADAEGDLRERCSRLAREASTNPRGANPVADLERTRPDARVKPRAADHLALVAREDPVHEVLAEVEPPAEPSQQVDLHPRAAWARGRPTASRGEGGRGSCRARPSGAARRAAPSSGS